MNSDLWPVDPSQRAEIAPLHGDALRRAITQPATGIGVFLEPSLVERLLADAADEPGVLPLLQETPVLLWEKRTHRFLSLSTYSQLGTDSQSGLAVAVANKADATLAALTPGQQMIIMPTSVGPRTPHGCATSCCHGSRAPGFVWS